MAQHQSRKGAYVSWAFIDLIATSQLRDHLPGAREAY